MQQDNPQVNLKPLERQVDGDHYKKFKIQPVEFCEANFGCLHYTQENIIKYVCRLGNKGGVEGARKDIAKIRHYLELYEQLNPEKFEEDTPERNKAHSTTDSLAKLNKEILAVEQELINTEVRYEELSVKLDRLRQMAGWNQTSKPMTATKELREASKESAINSIAEVNKLNRARLTSLTEILKVKRDELSNLKAALELTNADITEILKALLQLHESLAEKNISESKPLTAQEVDTPIGHVKYRCYQCDAQTDYLFPDSRCKKCTRVTANELIGSAPDFT